MSERRLLLVDSDPDEATSIADALAPHGYAVACACGAADALAMVDDFRPDAALVEVHPDAESGWERIAAFAERCPDMPCIAVAPADRGGVTARALREGAYDCLRKPVDPIDLLAALGRCCEKVELVRARDAAEAALGEREAELQRINARMKQVVESTRKLTVCARLGDLAPVLLEEFAHDMAAGGGSLYLRRDEHLVLAHALHPKGAPDRIRYDAEGDHLLSRVIETGQPALVPDVATEPGLRGTEWEKSEGGSLVAFPLKDETDTVDGVVCLFNGPDRPAFTPQDLDLGMFLAWAGSESLRALQAVEALLDSEERYRLIAENAQDVIWTMDLDLNFTYVSPSVERVMGYTTEEATGMSLGDLVSDEVWPELRERAARIAAGREPAVPGQTGNSRVLELRRRDGTGIWGEIGYSYLRSPTGEITGLMGVTRDISERKAAEDRLASTVEELARSNAELERFAYVASHDLQEPLRMVASYVRLLERRYHDRLDADAKDFIDFAVEGVTRMTTLINDLLAYSRVSTRGREFLPTDMGEVFDEALANLEFAVRECGARITCNALPTVSADRAQMLQLLQNLLGNAVKFHGEEPPRVTVSVQESSAEWTFCVRDNGIGIEGKHLEAIFTVFRRLHNRSEYPGTGIGLAVCHKIVERHGGRIWAESSPGDGAAFFFTLPKNRTVGT